MSGLEKAGNEAAGRVNTDGLTAEIASAIRKDYEDSRDSYNKLAKRFALPRETIAAVMQNLVFREPGYVRPGWALPQETWHFHKRLWERYGKCVLKFGEYESIIEQIRSGKAPVVDDDRFSPGRAYAVHLPTYPKGPIFACVPHSREFRPETVYEPGYRILCDGKWLKGPKRRRPKTGKRPQAPKPT